MSGRSSSLCVCVLVLLTLVRPAFPRGPAASSPPQQGRDEVGEISWTLGLRLYRALRADKVQNPLFSPLLLASSLAALGGRAGGSTARQLQEALNSSSSSALPLSDQREALSAALKSTRAASEISFDLHSASAVFTKGAPALDPEFLEEARSRLLLEHVPLGPGDGLDADLDALLAWARAGMGGAKGAEPTGEIKAEPGALILAHALHFRGLWDRGFEEDKQDLRNFLGAKYTKVSMIHRTGVFRHHEDMVNMVQVVELPLWRGKASLVLLLPFHVEPLARLDRILTPKQLGEWLKQLAGMSMAISLPRTTLTSTLNLQKHLSALGLTDAWDGETADFSGMAAQPGGAKGKLHLGGVLHWASLELSPEGGPGEEEEEEEDEKVGRPKLFYADHSFIVMVRDNATGALLLMGALDRAEGAGLHDEL